MMLSKTLFLVIPFLVVGSTAAGQERGALPEPGLPFAYLPQAVTSFGAETSGGWLYVLGGFHGQPHHYTAAGQSTDFYRISLADPRMVEKLPGVGRLQSVALVRHGEYLIRVGGMLAPETGADRSQLTSSNLVQRFHSMSQEWSDLPPLPEPRSSHDAVVVGDQLLVAGGWDVEGRDENRSWSDKVFALDLSDPEAQWSHHPSPAQARALGVAGTETHLVMIGGINPDRKIPGAVNILEVDTGLWSEGPEFPGEAFGPAAEAVNGRVYANGVDGQLFSWAVGEDDWRDEDVDLTHGRFFHQLVTDGDSLLALGGIRGMDARGRLRAIERIPLAPSDGHRLETFTIPFPGAAQSRTASYLEEGVLYVFGGHVTARDHDFSPQAFGDEAWSLHLSDLGWTRLASTPAPRQSMGMIRALQGDRVFAVGGVGHDGEVCRTQEAVWSYDLKGDVWAEAGKLPEGRTQVGLFWDDQALMVMGGMGFDPRADQPFTFPAAAVECSSGKTRPGMALPVPRRSFASAVLGDKFYAVGGMEEDGVPVDGCDVFDIESGQWQTIPAPSATRYGAHLIPFYGKLLLIGGRLYDEAGHLWDSARSIEAYDVKGGTWEVVVHDLGLDLDDAHVFRMGDRLLLFRITDGAAHVSYLSIPRSW